jgi:hypothetical protein
VSVTRRTPKFEQLERMVSEFARGAYELRVEGLTGINETKLFNLALTGRPALVPTRALAQAAARYGRDALAVAIQRGTLRSVSLLEAMARGIRGQVLLRFTSGTGNDLPWRPLSPNYLADKARKGLDRRIGIATGVLLRNLQRARWSIRRVR